MTVQTSFKCPTELADNDVPPALSDEGLALRFAAMHADQLRYVAAWGQWLLWDGKRWQIDSTLRAFDLSRHICRASASQSEKPNVAAKVASAPTVAAVQRLARADRRMAATVDQWDTDPWLLNTPGGTVDLRTGAMYPPRRDGYMTKITAVSPGGECPIWCSFLDRVTGGNTDLASFLQRMAGYCLTGITREHALFFIYGTGGNGKGVFLNTLTAILGDYSAVANVDAFTATSGDRHPTDLAMLRGARFVTAQETEEGRRWAESRIKALTGGDPITARFMRQDFFTFTPHFKLVIAGNHKPGIRNVDDAMRRRLHLIPFTVKIAASERDPNLPDKLRAEWSGILRWAIQGTQEWLEHGLQPPAIVRDATDEYLAEEDLVERWIGECCAIAKSAQASMTDLFVSWREWCQRSGELEGSQKRFAQNLRTKRPELTDWQCPKTRRLGLQGIQIVKQLASHWSDD
ncbi:MAG TPA: phage/plasmid primase, P4 family [Dongiaceae bacterium]|nr:phage/plasmid primase, P4 family [Dongiaceae bacterium]